LEARRRWIDTGHPQVSTVRQCLLAGVSRSSYYYAPSATETSENLAWMRRIDRIYLKWPFYGSPRMTDELREMGYRVNHKRVARLMRVMGLQAVVPGPHTSRPHPGHKVYPYLSRGMEIQAVNPVWCADITYIPLWQGYMYLVAVMDWFSRYVLAWEVANDLSVAFRVEALERALSAGTPGIFNTDQGGQFTSPAFTGALEGRQVRISRDGRGRAMDNLFVERLWRTVKYEDIYLKDYEDGLALRNGLGRYFRYYNAERRHSGLAKRAPATVYFG